MAQIHAVIRRINPAFKADFVQLGHIEHDQFVPLPLEAFKDLPLLSFIEKSDISDSFFIRHSAIPAFVTAVCGMPGFDVIFFDNMLVLMFNFNLDSNEVSTKKEG